MHKGFLLLSSYNFTLIYRLQMINYWSFKISKMYAMSIGIASAANKAHRWPQARVGDLRKDSQQDWKQELSKKTPQTKITYFSHLLPGNTGHKTNWWKFHVRKTINVKQSKTRHCFFLVVVKSFRQNSRGALPTKLSVPGPHFLIDDFRATFSTCQLQTHTHFFLLDNAACVIQQCFWHTAACSAMKMSSEAQLNRG